MAGILIKNGRVWDGDRFLYADILTEENRIVKIEKDISERADFVFDAAGKIVSAGLVDTHVHMRGISSDKYGIQAEMSCFPFGVTAAADAGGWHGDKALLDSFMLKNVVFAGVSIKDNRADLAKAEGRLAQYGDKAVGLKVYFDTAASEVSDTGPLRQVCAYARAKSLRVMVHCSNSPTPMADIVDALSAGDILTHIYHGGSNTIEADDYAAYKLAQQKGIILDVGMAGHIHTDFGVLKRAIHAGCLPHTVSTDITRFSAYKRGGRFGMTMCMNIAEALGMQKEDIFRAVTSAAAKALGKENDWGYLKVGRCADIAVFDKTHESFDLTDRAKNRVQNQKGYRCVLTVSDGQVVYKD